MHNNKNDDHMHVLNNASVSSSQTKTKYRQVFEWAWQEKKGIGNTTVP